MIAASGVTQCHAGDALHRRASPANLPAPADATTMQTIDFELDRDHVELNQLLKLVGLCDSGGAGKALVASGHVRVDGAAAGTRAGRALDLAGDPWQLGRRPLASGRYVASPAARVVNVTASTSVGL